MEILFNEKEHKYYDANDNIYTSVTTLIGQYTTFDKEFWGMYTALKDNGYKVKPEPELQKIRVAGVLYKLADLHKDRVFSIYYQQTLLKWNLLTIDGCNRGNTIHNALEDNINISKGGSKNRLITEEGNPIKGILQDLNKTTLAKDYPEVYLRLSKYIETGCTVFSEKRVFLQKYLIAGTIDVPIIKDKKVVILDWKTNKDELHTTAGYYKKIKIGNEWVKSKEWIQTGKRFAYPLNNLEDCKFNIYALQLSIYAYILEQWGYEIVPNGLEIIHFMPECKPKLIKVPYLRNEVITLLEHHKVKNNINYKT